MWEVRDSDGWHNSQDPAASAQADVAQPGLQFETIDNITPLDTQFGVFRKKTVPDALYDTLFGQPAPSLVGIAEAGGDASAVPRMLTYAILDAAKVMNLPELLDDSELEHRCLFNGSAYDDLKNVAPWIVRLEEGNTFTRNLFTNSDASWHLWNNEPGIYLRSSATLADMWRHFRKFTRVQDDNGKWLYWRFWEPKWLVGALRELNSHQQEAILSGVHTLIAVRARDHSHIISR